MLSHSGFLVRVARLELAASWSQTRRPTNWATPGKQKDYTPTSGKKQPKYAKIPPETGGIFVCTVKVLH